jgi:Mrp family chromosome partitioning ATPase
MSRPPALDPDAEQWAARFETLPPPARPAEEPPSLAAEEPSRPAAEEQPRKRGGGRWKTHVMGSMVPLDVVAVREEHPPTSEPASFRAQPAPEVQAQTPKLAASTLIHHDVPVGWRPNVDPNASHVAALRDAVLQQASTRRLSVAVTGAPGATRAHVAVALAMALSQGGARVLLVEADFDSPEIHQALAISAPTGAGFSQQLMARRQDKRARPWVVVRCSPDLHVLLEGRFRSPGMLASHEFEHAIRELREQHHIVVIHAPSLDKPGDLGPMGTLAQAVVVADPTRPATIQFGDNLLSALS